MALREIDDRGNVRHVSQLPHQPEFNQTWSAIEGHDRKAILAEINQHLDHLRDSPDPNWGSITNTSIEGGKASPTTGRRGDWTGTVFMPIYEACNLDEDAAGKFFGNVWKKAIIERDELWIGIRFDPTFPNRGITLEGKSYFLDRSDKGPH
jgi:hypothetical protein